MQTDSTAQLLADACPSIKYRVRSEILGYSASSHGMAELQAQILRDSTVAEVLSWQQDDGWLGWDFHGAKGIEAGIRILCEKGVQRSHPGLARALEALEMYTDRLDRGIGKVGKILDEQGFGGSLLIRAAVFAYGAEEKPFVQEQIEKALVGFQAVLIPASLDDLVAAYRGKLVFRPGVQWPSIYHLRLLALTRGWRTAENQKLVAKAVQRLVELSPLPNIHVRSKSQLIAPASFCMHDFNPTLDQMDDAGWMRWFHRMECLARLGVVRSVPELQGQVDVLVNMLDAGGYFTKKLSHPYFTRWGAYPGLMLEADWRIPERRVYDLTFRSKLILHYTGSEAA